MTTTKTHSFGTLKLTSAGAVSIYENGPTDLGASGTNVAKLGSLTVTSTGSITDSGIIFVSGNSTHS